jgi:hypothetical protein
VKPVITLITPTGDRPEAFALCEYWMSRQTCKEEIQWIVVDDGKVPTCVTSGQEYVRRKKTSKDPAHTLAENLKLAIPMIKGSKILIIEDDDYYSPEYVETMSKWLDLDDLVGEKGAKYYFLKDRSYRFWKEHSHASLCRTGFSSRVIPHLVGTLKHMKFGDWRIDLSLWSNYKGRKKARECSSSGKALCVGIKQMPGRTGITHVSQYSTADNDLSILREWTGGDFHAYSRFTGTTTKDVTVYTCLFGGYDKLGKPPGPGCHVVCYSEDIVPEGWNAIRVPRIQKTPKLESRYWKINSHLAFPGKDTLYIDANIRLLKPGADLARHMNESGGKSDFTTFLHNRSSNISEEVREILRLGFAEKRQVDTALTRKYARSPVAWGGCILRTSSESVAAANSKWWRLFSSMDYGRDQVILPIVLKRSGVNFSMLNEPTPFYGEKSEWMTADSSHRKRRSHR